MRRMISRLSEGETTASERCWYRRGRWPSKWIMAEDAGDAPFVLAFRKKFSLESDETVRIHVSADERYELYLDGERIGRGPERGDWENWFFETYDLTLTKGEHAIVARVWALGEMAPYAQISIMPGFILLAEDRFNSVLGTGVAEWQAKKLGGYEFISPGVAWGTGWNLSIDAARFDWGFENGQGEGWKRVQVLHEGTDKDYRPCYPAVHLLTPAALPPMLDKEISGASVRFVEEIAPGVSTGILPIQMNHNLESEIEDWTSLVNGGSITVPPHTRRRLIVDLNDYYCAYPELITTGGKGSELCLHWAESLYCEKEGKTKGQRDEIEGKYFLGVGDTFKPDGGIGRKLQMLWWQAGRYIELTVRTANEALTIDSFKLHETRYPLEMESSFKSNDLELNQVLPVAFRGLAICSHETYLDCPYYEQLQYIGDTRLEALVTYVVSSDDKLPQKALKCFGNANHHSGLTRSSHPSRMTQLIPPFSLWWVAMLHDYALWRGNREFIKNLMPKARQIMDTFLRFMNDDGLVVSQGVGWSFCDWVPSWEDGVPPEGNLGVSALINWQFVLILPLAAELEKWLGESELANRDERLADELAERMNHTFWNENRGLFSDTLDKKYYSEHTQCMAVLSGKLSHEKISLIKESLLNDSTLARTTIYFTHYLFETYSRLGCMDAFMKRMDTWFELEKTGLKTPYETPEPTRSDCHGWGSHPIYHYFTTLLGIRPGSFGFESVVIAPRLGTLTSASGSMVHPAGKIVVDFVRDKSELSGTITLPRNITGILRWNGQELELNQETENFKIGV